MIRFVRGNIFDSKAQALVNTVNCVGVMGKGLAKEFRDRFPDMFRDYQAACRRREVRSGRPFVHRQLDRTVICVPTKDNWKGPSKYEFVEAGLEALRQNYRDWGVTSLAVPALGCGLGGLEWAKVKELISRYLGDLPIDVEVYEPGPTDARLGKATGRKPVARVNMTVALALVGELIRRARIALPASTPLGKLLVQKLAFFAQFAGAPIGLKFEKSKFGPHDYDLNHMIERLEGLYFRDESASWSRSDLRVLDEEGWSRALEPYAPLVVRYSRYLDATVELLASRSLDDVELLATAQFAWSVLVSSGLSGAESEVIDFVRNWSPEKRDKFPPERVSIALQVLDREGWLGPGPPGTPSPLVDPTPEAGELLIA